MGILWDLCSEGPQTCPMGLPSSLPLLMSPPSRELEAEIFQLGIRLEELKDHVEQNQQEPEQTGSDSALDSPPATPSPHQPTGLPSPSGQAPELATQILCPEVPLCPTILDCFFVPSFLRELGFFPTSL